MDLLPQQPSEPAASSHSPKASAVTMNTATPKDVMAAQGSEDVIVRSIASNHLLSSCKILDVPGYYTPTNFGRHGLSSPSVWGRSRPRVLATSPTADAPYHTSPTPPSEGYPSTFATRPTTDALHHTPPSPLPEGYPSTSGESPSAAAKFTGIHGCDID